mmetsp:Transcript_80371/g.222321  ORF Transcript_80371/g.222321 Transcript_80371/m.222321 type:complete len:234 (-) Transcript_80371:341-1042(-)
MRPGPPRQWRRRRGSPLRPARGRRRGRSSLAAAGLLLSESRGSLPNSQAAKSASWRSSPLARSRSLERSARRKSWRGSPAPGAPGRLAPTPPLSCAEGCRPWPQHLPRWRPRWRLWTAPPPAAGLPARRTAAVARSRPAAKPRTTAATPEAKAHIAPSPQQRPRHRGLGLQRWRGTHLRGFRQARSRSCRAAPWPEPATWSRANAWRRLRARSGCRTTCRRATGRSLLPAMQL